MSDSHYSDAQDESEASVTEVPPSESEAGDDVDEDNEDPSSPMEETFAAVDNADTEFEAYNSSRRFKIANKAGELGEKFTESLDTTREVKSTLVDTFDHDALQSLRDGVSTLMDSIPGLLRALDEIAKLHPFIGIAVSAFRVVVELDLKRRENDRKIGLLFVEMRDMMAALLQLREIHDEDSVGPGGVPIKARLQDLVNRTASDIKSCANACQTYAKKRLIVKVLKGGAWNEALAGFVALFARRRQEFVFALALHVGAGVDGARSQLDALDAKLDTALAFFQRYGASGEQRDLAELVRRKGGVERVAGDEELLDEVVRALPAILARRGEPRERDGEFRGHLSGGGDLDVVLVELAESPEVAMRRHAELFDRMFRLQEMKIVEAVDNAARRESDRVIAAVTSGAHDRLLDPDIHDVWKEMHWRGSVKARHFVLALRDHYSERVETYFPHLWPKILEEDRWALEYMDVGYVQPIMEAFDDDGTGFITVSEVNQFTSARPRKWSLLHWLAYWAIGCQLAAKTYCLKIEELFDKMFAIRPHIHPANRTSVDRYLHVVYKRLHTLTASLRMPDEDVDLQARFQSYIDSEEQRLRTGLVMVHWDIDSLATLRLVTGPGRIEKFMFPLMYLLLERDFEIFRIARTRILGRDELWDSADSMTWVFDVVNTRYYDLIDVFRQQKLDPTDHFKTFAFECFDYWHDYSAIWSFKELRKNTEPEDEYDDSTERQDVDPETFLMYATTDGSEPPNPELEDLFDRWDELLPDSDSDTESEWGTDHEESASLTGGTSELEASEMLGRSIADSRASTFSWADTEESAGSDDSDDLPDTPVHLGIKCTVCQDTVRGPRLVCLRCWGRSTFDLCTQRRCRAAIVTKEDKEDQNRTHLPTHEMFKLRECIIQWRDIGHVFARAEAARDKAKDLLRRQAGTRVKVRDGRRRVRRPRKTLTCVGCATRVTRPCWYCVECEEDVFVCETCDERGGVSAGAHAATHALVFVPEKAARSAEDPVRLARQVQHIEDRLGTVEGRIANVHALLERMVVAVETGKVASPM